MEGSHDYAQLMHWNGRLRLLAQLQGAYHEQLQTQGFDDEQSFMLVRDWSSRAWEWTLREDPAALEHDLPPAPRGAAGGVPGTPPPGRTAGEPYLIPVDRLSDEEASLGATGPASAHEGEHDHGHDPTALDDIDEAA